MIFDWLTSGGILPFNPAASVRGPKHVVKRGKTPVLTAGEARQLLNSIVPDDPAFTPTLIDLRDRALIAVMVYSFAHVGAALGMQIADYYQNGKCWWLRLHEKGGKLHELSAHHNAEAYLDAYLTAAAIADDRKGPLFRSAAGKTGQLTAQPLRRNNALDMVKRRARAAGLSDRVCNNTFRATGITALSQAGGTIEKAQQIAAHESPKTTMLYDRASDQSYALRNRKDRDDHRQEIPVPPPAALDFDSLTGISSSGTQVEPWQCHRQGKGRKTLV